MLEPLLPPDEPERLAGLRSLNILDTLPEERFDRYTRLARRLFGVPIALVSLVDANRQWFKPRQGLDAAETGRAVSFCGPSILERQTMVIPDALSYARFADNPLVVGVPNVRFYAGRPLFSPEGHALGTLCIIDHVPRDFDAEDLAALEDLARLVEAEFTALQAATTDPLTGLSNRRGFFLLAEHLRSACERTRQEALLMFIDLDRFKSINDTHGHAVGDQALLDTADILRHTFRQSDVIGRMGGDEFCVLCIGTRDEVTVRARMERAFIRHNAEAGRPYNLQFSAGIVHFDSEQHRSIAALLKRSDALMYADKSG